MKNEKLSLFGNRLKKIRLSKGLTQEALADKAGLHSTYVGSVERGERNVSLVNIHKFAVALEVQVQELFA